MDVEKLNDISKKNILVFGDYMVDKYIMGKVERISPEAPVPVINVENENLKLGGAGNVINNLISLGSHVKALGCVGNDDAGCFIINSFINEQVDTSFFQKYDSLKTIIKTRIVSKTHQFARIDIEEKEPLPNEYYNYIQDNIDIILQDIHVVVISDYAKGAVSELFSQLLIKYSINKNIPVIIDPKGIDYYKYRGATIITPNMKEFCDVCKEQVEKEDDILKYGQKLINEFQLENLLITRSEKGISFINKTKKQDFPAKAKEVIDVSGAGDTVVAAVAILVSCNFEIEEICELANVAASVVVSKFGTSTLTLKEWIYSIDSNSNLKVVDLDTLKYIVNELKKSGKKIVFTNGCFDLLHAGHVSSFEQAKEFGDILVVAVNSDNSVKKNKSDLRPIINQDDRLHMVSSLEIIDYVVLMDDLTPNNIINTIRPDICVKGEDWKNKNMPERELIESYGGKLEFIKHEKDYSTTKIIEKILKVYEKE